MPNSSESRVNHMITISLATDSTEDAGHDSPFPASICTGCSSSINRWLILRNFFSFLYFWCRYDFCLSAFARFSSSSPDIRLGLDRTLFRFWFGSSIDDTITFDAVIIEDCISDVLWTNTQYKYRLTHHVVDATIIPYTNDRFMASIWFSENSNYQ